MRTSTFREGRGDFFVPVAIALRTLCSENYLFIFIYAILLLCGDIPVPEFKTAVIFLLSTVSSF